MELLYNWIHKQHDTGMHPENPKRLSAFSELPETEVISGESYLTLVHTKEYLERLKDACLYGGHIDPDTAISRGSYEAACYAVGATIMAAEQGDFALVRPPGHHAYADRASGFCLLNNVAVATQMLVEQGKRVLIFDFDGHLGDGTADIFYQTDRVLYWSLHQYPAFPGKGFIHELGEGNGKGFTINIPLPKGSADDIFMNAIETFLPLARNFQPDVVAVSAGFDAHQYDLLLDLRVTAGTFHKIGVLLRENFDKLFAVLEGGYNVEELYKCTMNFHSGINGKPMPYEEKPTESSRTVWEEYDHWHHALIHKLSAYWQLW